jgi:hypothetical protein
MDFYFYFITDKKNGIESNQSYELWFKEAIAKNIENNFALKLLKLEKEISKKSIIENQKSIATFES